MGEVDDDAGDVVGGAALDGGIDEGRADDPVVVHRPGGRSPRRGGLIRAPTSPPLRGVNVGRFTRCPKEWRELEIG